MSAPKLMLASLPVAPYTSPPVPLVVSAALNLTFNVSPLMLYVNVSPSAMALTSPATVLPTFA